LTYPNNNTPPTTTTTKNREGEDASKKFCEDDIDAILQQRATRIVHDAAMGKEGKVRAVIFGWDAVVLGR
jgi:hypothetical protein